MSELKIVTPTGMFGAEEGEDFIVTALRIIGVGFGPPEDWCAKYGTNYENDVFAMRTFYWGECECGFNDRAEVWHDANPHAEDCYQSELTRREKAAGIHYTQFMESDGSFDGDSSSYDERQKLQAAIYADLAEKFGTDRKLGAAVHCTCYRKHAAETFYASDNHSEKCGLVVPNFHFKPSNFKCSWYKYIGRDMEGGGELPGDFMQQIFASHPSGMTLDDAISETAKREEESAVAFSKMFSDFNMASE